MRKNSVLRRQESTLPTRIDLEIQEGALNLHSL